MLGLNRLSSCTLLLYTALFTIYNSLSEILRIPGDVRRRNLDVHFFSFFKKHTVIPQPKCKTHKKKKKYLKVCPPCLGFQKTFIYRMSKMPLSSLWQWCNLTLWALTQSVKWNRLFWDFESPARKSICLTIFRKI